MKRALNIWILLVFIICMFLTGCTEENKIIESQSPTDIGTRVNHTLREEQKKPEIKIDERLEAYKKENPDVIALIQIPDTLLEYPLMYREGEEEYYLRKDIHGEYDIGGLPFMQQGCSLYENNVFIYGHYFKTGEMFGCLHNYLNNEEFYDSHKDIIITTATEKQIWRIFAVCEMHVEEAGFIYNSAEYINFNTYAEFDKYISSIQKNNKLNTEETINYSDRVMFLSTCYDYSGSSKRIVAFAKLIDSHM